MAIFKRDWAKYQQSKKLLKIIISKFEGMLKPNELRLGNWFHYDHKDGRTGYAQVMFGVDIDSIQKGYINASPILLTPEILEKIGFTKDPYYEEMYGHSNYKLNIEKDFAAVCNDFSYDERSYELSFAYYGKLIIKYLHQLQNLYFTLTGEELKVESASLNLSASIS